MEAGPRLEQQPQPADGALGRSVHAASLLRRELIGEEQPVEEGGQVVERLDLHDLTLVVHDFGGPIGLSYAIEHPENVRSLVLMNTWMWSLEGEAAMRWGAALLGSPVGRLLYERLNIAPRVEMRLFWGDRSSLTPAVHRQYITAFPTPQSRHGAWVLARELMGSSAWYEGLWSRRGRLAGKPAMLAWGLKDPGFGGQLGRCVELFPDAEVYTFPSAGHFVQEEQPERLGEFVSAFLRRHDGAD